MTLSKEDYKLYTGSCCSLTMQGWNKVVKIAESRLASFLCLEQLPEPLAEDLAMVLANFIAAIIRFSGDGQEVTHKTVRNFSITFGGNGANNAWAQIKDQYADIIDKYSACDCSLGVETSARRCCGW